MVTAVNRRRRDGRRSSRKLAGAHDDAPIRTFFVRSHKIFYSSHMCHQILPMNLPSFDINVTPPSKM